MYVVNSLARNSIDLFRMSVIAHEDAHSTLIRQLVAGDDPAVAIEGLIDPDDDTLDESVNSAIALRDGNLIEPHHDQVLQFLIEHGFDQPVKILSPKADGTYESVDIASFARLGIE